MVLLTCMICFFRTASKESTVCPKYESYGTPMPYMCHRLKIGDMEKTTWFVCSGSSKHLEGTLADMQANYGISSVHVQCFSH